MDVVGAIAVIGRATWRFLKFCNECWRDIEKEDFDNDDYLNNSIDDDSGDSETKPERKKKSVASTTKKRRTNIKIRSTASSEISREPEDVVKWKNTSIENAVEHIDTAVVGGYDIRENDLWIIRARFKGQVIPGMFNQYKKKAVVASKREDRNVVKSVDNFEVLCYRTQDARNRIRWTKCSNGEVPKNAVEAGRIADDKLYVGREIHEEEGHPGKDIQCPGMVQPKHGVLYVTYENEVYAHKHYEVLCID